MIQTRDQIEAHLDHARSELSSNLSELERRAASAVDWKQQFDANPGTLLAVAFGTGFVLSLLLGGRRRSRNSVPPTFPASAVRGNSEIWDKLKGALIGLAAARVTDYVGQLIPAPEHLRNQTPEAFAANSKP